MSIASPLDYTTYGPNVCIPPTAEVAVLYEFQGAVCPLGFTMEATTAVATIPLTAQNCITTYISSLFGFNESCQYNVYSTMTLTMGVCCRL